MYYVFTKVGKRWGRPGDVDIYKEFLKNDLKKLDEDVEKLADPLFARGSAVWKVWLNYFYCHLKNLDFCGKRIRSWEGNVYSTWQFLCLGSTTLRSLASDDECRTHGRDQLRGLRELGESMLL
eukprot:Sspe_Gene.106037::Locus_83185_Transcript_1_1_Confidence_1.000_Length_368::g.106037::m.106037